MALTLPITLLTILLVLICGKVTEMVIVLLSERDFFKSGHSQFVHNLKEGLVIVNDRLKSIMLINVAAR